MVLLFIIHFITIQSLKDRASINHQFRQHLILVEVDSAVWIMKDLVLHWYSLSSKALKMQALVWECTKA